jgi:hypothetical protein
MHRQSIGTTVQAFKFLAPSPSPRKRLVFAAALLGLFAARPTRASDIISDLSTTPDSSDFGYIFSELGVQSLDPAGQFTLSSSATLSSVSAMLSDANDNTGLSVSNLRAEILNDSGGVVGSTVEATSAGGSGTIGEASGFGIAYKPISFSFTSENLAAGTYWIQIYNPVDQDGVYWDLGVPPVTNTGIDGSVTGESYQVWDSGGSDGTGYVSDGPLLFQINGSAVPEPSSLSMLVIGATGLLSRRRRSKGVSALAGI